MGVQGLWDLLSPIGRPVSLETLENKVLAVDVSIWLNQAIKGIRDKKGESVPNAHLLSIFHKICKLLFYKIKPVFVFDGSVPLLKKQTVLARQTQRDVAANNAKKASHNILKNYIIRNLKSQKCQAGTEKQNQLCDQVKKTVTSDIYSASNDMYYMSSNAGDSNEPYSPSESDDEMEMYSDDYILQNFQNPSLIDFETEEFKSLPLEVQHELLNTISETHKRRYWVQQEMPEEYQTFSSYQLDRLLQRRKIHRRLEEVQQDITTRNTASLETIYKSYLNMDTEKSRVEASRVMSEDSSHFILVKQKNSDKSQPKVQRETADKCQNEVVEANVEEKSKNPPSSNTAETIVLDENISKNGVNSIDRHMATELVLQDKIYNEVSNGDSCVKEVTLNSVDNVRVNTSSQIPSSYETETNDSFQKPVTFGSSSTDEISELSPNSSHSNEITTSKSNNATLNFVRCEKDKKSTKQEDATACNQDITVYQEEKMHIQNAEHVTEKNEELSSSVSADVTSQQSDDDDELVPVEDLETIEESLNIEDVRTEENMNAEKLKGTDYENVEGGKEDSCSFLLEAKDSISLTKELETLNREKQKQERRAQTIAEYMYEETKELLKLFGIPFIDSPTEAEAQCAKLDILNLTNGTVTDDSDVWLFGGKCVYKNFFAKNKYVEFFKYTDIESHFNLDRPKLIALAMLTGSDYTQGIQGIGPVTAMEILSEFPGDGIEPLKNFKKWWSDFKTHKELPKNAVCEKLSKFDLDDGFPSEIVYDAYLHPTVDESTESFTWGHPDLDQLREFAGEKFEWDRKKIDDMLLPVLKKLNENQLQTRIDSFFQVKLRKEENPFSSKRLKKAITKMHSQGTAASNKKSRNKIPDKSRRQRKQTKKSTASSSVKQSTEINLSEESSSDS